MEGQRKTWFSFLFFSCLDVHRPTQTPTLVWVCLDWVCTPRRGIWGRFSQNMVLWVMSTSCMISSRAALEDLPLSTLKTMRTPRRWGRKADRSLTETLNVGAAWLRPYISLSAYRHNIGKCALFLYKLDNNWKWCNSVWIVKYEDVGSLDNELFFRPRNALMEWNSMDAAFEWTSPSPNEHTPRLQESTWDDPHSEYFKAGGRWLMVVTSFSVPHSFCAFSVVVVRQDASQGTTTGATKEVTTGDMIVTMIAMTTESTDLTGTLLDYWSSCHHFSPVLL